MPSDSPRSTQPILTFILVLLITACSGPPQTETASPRPASAAAPTRTAGANVAGITAGPEPGELASNPAQEGAAEPPPPSTREIHGYFTDTATPNSLRLWKGPNDRGGFENLTRFTVEVDGAPEYSRAVSAVLLAGVCRSSGKGLDQLLLSFHPGRRGGAAVGVLRYDTEKRRFVLGFAPKDARMDCTGGRSLFPEGTAALPCTCPWRDGPDDRSGAAAATSEARDVLIGPEEMGGPAFTRGEGDRFPEGNSEGDDRP